jgi:hypothetical protein
MTWIVSEDGVCYPKIEEDNSLPSYYLQEYSHYDPVLYNDENSCIII